MTGIRLILAAVVVIAATVNFGAEGFPRPQRQGTDQPDEIFMVDGFAFDGPADRSRPTGGSPIIPTRPPIVVPTFPTLPPIVPNTPTQSPIVAPTPTTLSPDVALCVQNCQVTSEYDPVCGSNGVMYSNNGLLNCARNCGANVLLSHVGRCTSNLRG